MTGALDWGEAQWNTVQQTVHDEALRARVAASFLPLFGPLPADTQAVPLNELQLIDEVPGTQMRLGVNDWETRRLTTVSVNLYLKGAQVADPELAAALMLFRRAAAIAARMEDEIIFNGQEAVNQGPPPRSGAPGSMPGVYKVSGGGAYKGLLTAADINHVKGKLAASKITGPAVFEAVVSAIQEMELRGYLGPYACVMGNGLFKAITTPMDNSMVLPRDSIIPFLDGPLMRSGAVPPNQAVVVSLQGAPVEIVVPTEIGVKYLQTSTEGNHVFRVQQKFLLRVKEAGAITAIEF